MEEEQEEEREVRAAEVEEEVAVVGVRGLGYEAVNYVLCEIE